MKVLHLYKDYPPVLGGIEGHVALLARGEARRGCEVTVLVTAAGAKSAVSVEEGVRVIRAGRWATLASTPLSPALLAWVRRLEADVTHLHFPYPWGEVAHLAFGRSRATVLTYHSDIVRQRLLGALYRPLAVRLLARCRRILVASPPQLASSPLLERFSQRCRLLPYGVETARFAPPDSDRPPLYRRLEGPTVLFVGRLRYYKGLDVLLAAMPRVSGQLVVVGDGPMASEWRRLAAASPASERIHFVGEVPESLLPGYYQGADLFVLPSTRRSEAFGLVLLEAMAAGLPVISTELGTGTSFVNRHGETGLVVPPGDPEALAAALDRLLRDPGARARFGAAARRRVSAEYAAESMVAATLEVYREVSDEASRNRCER